VVKSTKIPKIFSFKDSFRKEIKSNFCIQQKLLYFVERSNNKWEKDKRKPASNDELVE
jgi:hypothetical protein